MDYTTLSFAEVTDGLRAVARDAEATFGRLDARQLNWKPDPKRWSVAQCFEHLLTANDFVLRSAERALRGSPSSVWQRVPVLPGMMGRALIRSQAPGGTRKYRTPRISQPTASEISADVIQRFAHQQRQLAEWTVALDEHEANRAIMLSPFIRVVAYSVTDGLRLLVAHDHRHFEQARRVTQSPEFPN